VYERRLVHIEDARRYATMWARLSAPRTLEHETAARGADKKRFVVPTCPVSVTFSDDESAISRGTRPDLTHDLDRISQPVLVLYGERDAMAAAGASKFV
jgi:hypothetical protein